MKIAPQRTGSRVITGSKDDVAVFLRINGIPKFDRVTLDNGEIVTLATYKVPHDTAAFLDKITTNVDFLQDKTPRQFVDETLESVDYSMYVGAALLNSQADQANKRVGREVAARRLASYIDFGIVKKHPDGKSADHFVLEIDKDELVPGWRTKAAQMVYDNTFLGKCEFNNQGFKKACDSFAMVIDAIKKDNDCECDDMDCACFEKF